ncbi:MAG: TolB family protein [Chloroflexota bacterium]
MTYTHECERPELVVTSTCSFPVAVRIENRGGTMLELERFNISAPDGEVVSSGGLLPGVGEDHTISLGGRTPYVTYEFVTDGYSTITDTMSDCGQPVLMAEFVCDPVPAFIVTNNGSSTAATHTAHILTSDGTLIASESLTLAAGAVQVIAVPEDSAFNGPLTLTTGDFGITVDSATLECDAPTRTGTAITPDPVPPVIGFANLAQLPTWQDVPTCGVNCPIFQLYHTDEVGGWEIFRLDGADALNRITWRENLSLGLDENVANMSPSLSPDYRWVVFQSDRDGNWELYVAPTSGGDPDAVRRLTFNSVAVDADPMWGSSNFVVFETTRHGVWDLYMIDMSTGREYRLTDDDGNDTNPFWSPDGSRVVFQSDRPDANGVRQWAIFEMNLATRTVSRLSDGSGIDVDPQYSHDGRHIVFRTYTAENATSVLAVMDADGGNRRIISDPIGDATNAAWSPSDRYIAYQSDLNGGLDVYVYDMQSGQTRQVTIDEAPNYAPTWMCDDEHVMFTSDAGNSPNIFVVRATPIDAPPVLAIEDADQMTFEDYNDIYPLSTPAEENASREGQTMRGAFGEQTSFLSPPTVVTLPDPTLDGAIIDIQIELETCPVPVTSN